jgi:hypothetical protein
MKPSDYRFWLLFATVSVALLVACSNSNTGGSSSDGAAEDVADSMTAG